MRIGKGVKMVFENYNRDLIVGDGNGDVITSPDRLRKVYMDSSHNGEDAHVPMDIVNAMCDHLCIPRPTEGT